MQTLVLCQWNDLCFHLFHLWWWRGIHLDARLLTFSFTLSVSICSLSLLLSLSLSAHYLFHCLNQGFHDGFFVARHNLSLHFVQQVWFQQRLVFCRSRSCCSLSSESFTSFSKVLICSCIFCCSNWDCAIDALCWSSKPLINAWLSPFVASCKSCIRSWTRSHNHCDNTPLSKTKFFIDGCSISNTNLKTKYNVIQNLHYEKILINYKLFSWKHSLFLGTQYVYIVSH